MQTLSTRKTLPNTRRTPCTTVALAKVSRHCRSFVLGTGPYLLSTHALMKRSVYMLYIIIQSIACSL